MRITLPEYAMRLSIVPFGLACLLIALPAAAGVRHRAGIRTGADGGAARAHGTLASRGDGRAAWHAGGSEGDGQGDRSHARASGVVGPDGRAARGSRTTVGADGTTSHQRGYRMQGAAGGSASGGHSVERSPDGSLQASQHASGQGAAGGSFSTSGTRARSAEGERSAGRQTQASGTRGSYAGSTTRGDGTLDHDSTLTGTSGNTYQGQTTFTRGEGMSHTGTCTNAQGQTIQCK